VLSSFKTFRTSVLIIKSHTEWDINSLSSSVVNYILRRTLWLVVTKSFPLTLPYRILSLIVYHCILLRHITYFRSSTLAICLAMSSVIHVIKATNDLMIVNNEWTLHTVEMWCDELDLSANSDKIGLVAFTRRKKLPGFFESRFLAWPCDNLCRSNI
jgi:hypothetical protein